MNWPLIYMVCGITYALFTYRTVRYEPTYFFERSWALRVLPLVVMGVLWPLCLAGVVYFRCKQKRR